MNPGQKFQRQELYQCVTETTYKTSGIMAISRVRVGHIGKISRLPPRSRVGIDLAPRGLRPLGARSIPPRSLGGRLRYFAICPPLPHDIAPLSIPLNNTKLYCRWSDNGVLGLPQPDNRELRVEGLDGNESCLAAMETDSGLEWHDRACYHEAGTQPSSSRL